MNLETTAKNTLGQLGWLIGNERFEELNLANKGTLVTRAVLSFVNDPQYQLQKPEKITVVSKVFDLVDFLVSNWLSDSGKIKKVNLMNIRTIWLSVKVIRNAISDIFEIVKNKKSL